MQEQDPSPTSLPKSKPKKRLDTVVKLALGVLVMSFTMIWGGMYLSRPDRSIPPYSVGSQVGHIVAMHVPHDTTNEGIETLVKRFRKVGRLTHHFAKMKVQPTTPGDPGGWYRKIVVYVFDDYGWTEPEMLNKYLAGDAEVVRKYEKAMRGYYRLQDQEEEGGLGPMPKTDVASDATSILFKGLVTDPVPEELEHEDFSISPM
ncbi:MAG: hypothetical protein E8D50_04745 [Nitrospira sp.]|nr:MAG: hypothetical protein E8D50_04745 [Nitrospira sp.]